MKHRIKALALLAAAGVATAGCGNDFLTEVPYSFVAPENLYTSGDGALAALSGAYAAFQARVSDLGISDVDYYGRQYWMLTEYPTETVTLRLGATNERTMPDIFRVTPSHNYINGVWRAAFHAVNRANSVIDNVPGIAGMDPALRDRVVGEAKFLRAYHYFNLVRFFGGVPLYLHETRSLEDIQKPRATQAEVYQAIIQDLKDAAAVLPARYTGADVGRATSGAANALLAKVYLQYGAVGGGGYMCDQFAPRPLPSQTDFPYCDSQNPSFGPEWPFFYSYAPTDTRKAGTWLMTYTKKSGATVTWDSTQTAVNAYGNFAPVPTKYMDKTPGAQDGAEEPNFILIRYADVLLSLAEAINENAGPTAEAYNLVNTVRARAHVPPLTPGLGKQAFKDALFVERRWEFAMEGHGHFDSQRNWSWAKARIEQYSTNAARTFWNRPRPSGCSSCIPRDSSVPKVTLTLDDHLIFYPIPQPAIDVNPQLVQNPGY
jgi:starch-binding outer membrane protein, SusD/RagB family